MSKFSFTAWDFLPLMKYKVFLPSSSFKPQLFIIYIDATSFNIRTQAFAFNLLAKVLE
jgi:hypothetical protein